MTVQAMRKRVLSHVNCSCRLASINFAGSPPRADPVAGRANLPFSLPDSRAFRGYEQRAGSLSLPWT